MLYEYAYDQYHKLNIYRKNIWIFDFVNSKISAIGAKIEGEICQTYDATAPVIPNEGWALFERPPPGRLDKLARDFLVDIFEDGRKDKNQRCSPQSAELKLRDKFPDCENCWLSVKQVKYYLLKTFY